MNRTALLALLFTMACGGGGDPTTGPKAVATVTVGAVVTTITVGQQVTLTFAAFDVDGTSVSGKTAAWESSAPQVASVSPAGVVTGVSPGAATITATVDGKVGSRDVTVTTTASACNGVAPLSLQLGEARVLTGAERAAICLAASAAANEYMLLEINNSLDTTGKTLSTSLSATGTVPAIGPPTSIASLQRFADVQPVGSLQRFADLQAVGSLRAPRNHAFDLRLRRLERAELGGRMRARGREAAYDALRKAAGARAFTGGGTGALKGVVGVPAIGTVVTLNTRSSQSCSNPTFNTGRVVAIGASSIIIADTLAPAGGFNTAEYTSFAATFDTLVFALDTTAFGAPSDMDANGRVVIFFTQAVNQLTAKGASSVIGGFFFARDLFPVAGNSALGLQPCAASNEAEMFYVPVVDPGEIYNQYFKSKDSMLTDLVGTLAHEFQHLINAGRRAYVTVADDFETVWLGEGLSHIAEELLFLRISGLSTKLDIGLTHIKSTPAITSAANAYVVDNFLRLGEYLKAPGATSPYVNNDNLSTRGATWQFLRYLVDQAPQPENTYFRALVNAKTNGMANLTTVAAPLFPGGIPTLFRSWALAQYLDNTGLSSDPLLQNRTWNFRSLLTNQLGFTTFPLATRPLVDGGTQSFTLQAGGAAYLRFRLNAGSFGTIIPTTLPGAVDLVLVRTQ